MPEIKFVFAGKGPLEDEIDAMGNIENVGFQKDDTLNALIKNALFSVYPSEWYENCPFSVIESMMLGTPVLGADIGGIPELIDNNVNGELFGSGDVTDMKDHILKIWSNRNIAEVYCRNLQRLKFDCAEDYAKKILRVYAAE